MAGLLWGACAAPQKPGLVLTRFYFGLAVPSGGLVDSADFETFLDTCITPRFPDGLTRYRAQGQWKGKDGKVVKEPSMVVEIIRPGNAEAAGKVKDIAGSYKRRFEQEAVLVVEDNPRVEF